MKDPFDMPVFQPFLQACSNECRTLVDDHGFEMGEPKVAGRECSLTYRKLPNVAVTFIYEPSSAPFPMITLRNGPEYRGNRHFEVSLKRLMRSRRPKWKPPPRLDDPERRVREAIHESVRALTVDLPEILEAAEELGPRMRKMMGWKR